MITLNEIADMAGVSPSTVSRALRDNPHINMETRQKIQRIAKEYNYKKFSIPAADPGFRNVGIIVPEVASGYYAKLVHIANDYLLKQNLSLLLRLSGFDPRTLLQHIYSFQKMDVSCLLIVVDDAEQISDQVYNALKDIALPAMFITTQYSPNMDFDSIYVDEARGIRLGIEHLLCRGYKKIGFIGEGMTLGRLKNFRDIMQEFGVPVTEKFVKISDCRAEAGGYDCMKQLLAQEEKPDAIFAGYDQMAIGALKAAEECSCLVPEDIAVIGFDNAIVSKYVHKGLTTIEPPFQDMMAIAARVLQNRVSNQDGAPQQIALRPQLIIRGTT